MNRNSTTIQTYEKEFYTKKMELQEKYSNLIKDEIIQILKKNDMYEVPVLYKKIGKEGKIGIQKYAFDSVDYDIIFFPKKKNGEYSKNYSRVYEISPRNYNFEEKLKELFEIILMGS